ncbi:MAG: SNF2 helicase-associated domain-containing protein, partial [Verrucomicrobiota bacterium]
MLSEAELEKLLQSEAPLVSLKGRWVEIDRDRLR